MVVRQNKSGDFRFVCNNNELAVLTSLVDDAFAALGNGYLKPMERVYKHSLRELRIPLLGASRIQAVVNETNTGVNETNTDDAIADVGEE